MQQGNYVAECIQNPSRTSPFVYKDPGSMATIGRHRAVVQKDRLRLTGFVAWLAWLFVHLIKLMSMRNKVLVFVQWTWSYLTWERGARLITGRTPKPRPSLPVSNDSRSQ
jgi:NADH dehydrogenase